MNVNDQIIGYGFKPTFISQLNGRFSMIIYYRERDKMLMTTPNMDQNNAPGYKVWFDDQVEQFKERLSLLIEDPRDGQLISPENL